MNSQSVLTQVRGALGVGAVAPMMLMVILAMMVLPLAPPVLDVMFTVNITLSIVILLSVFYVMRPLEFSAFPTVLLFATLFRLSLNVASTRVVLMHGHAGGDAAGQVIQAFGDFVIGGNYAVGLVVFIILTIVNFMVVTKGAERVSEVSARFVLDALPGRQMAIDADLNAGSLTRDEARARREDVRAEADFYGSMDGASKFVRGDAVAGILILLINLIGGLAIGVLQHDMSMGDAAKRFALLTIGDGLVAQVPALLLSTAVAVLVTCMSRSSDMSRAVASQLFANPRVLGMAAALLMLVGVIPGMPNLFFLLLAAITGGAAWWLARKRAAAAARAALPPAEEKKPETAELSWEDVQSEDALGLEVGYRLIPLVDVRQGGTLMSRIKGVRRKLSQELGFLVPPVHVRDNLSLPPAAYRVLLHGVVVAEAQIHPDRELALDPGHAVGRLEGIPTRDPAFGMDAVWIERGARDHAQSLGYTVVDGATVIATHLSQQIKLQAQALLGHDETQALLDQLARSAPKLVEDLVPKLLPLSTLVKVLQALLAERVSIRNLRMIAETLAAHASQSQDPVVLAGHVRVALGRQIVQEISGQPAGSGQDLGVLTLAAPLEQVLQEGLRSGAGAIEPGLAERLQRTLAEQSRRQEKAGNPAVLLVHPLLRSLLARFTRRVVPELNVLAFDEVPDEIRIRVAGEVG